jgi:hypothetical protein
MEPLWSPVVATGGNQRQIDRTRKARKQGETVATSCQRLPEKFHGKEGVGVDGSSPSEGSKKACKSPFRVVCAELRVRRGSTRGARSGQFAALSLPDRLSIACFRQPPGRTRVARAPTIMVRGRRLIRGRESPRLVAAIAQQLDARRTSSLDVEVTEDLVEALGG